MKTFTFLVGLFFCVQIFSQNIGDYQTNTAVTQWPKNWTDLTAWQVYTASGWVGATQYPGKNSPNNDSNATVTIQGGTTIEVPSTAITLYVKNVYVKGSLVLLGDLNLPSTTNFYVEKGVVLLDKAKQLILPAGAVLSMDIDNITTQGFQPKDGNSDCNGNTAVVIGGSYYTACAGGGSGHVVAGDFTQLNTTATTIKSNPATNPNVTEACKGASFGLVGGYIYSGTGTAPTVSYKWQLVSAPAGYSFSTSTQQNTNTGVLNFDGDYVFRLTVSAYGANSYRDIKITVGKTVVFTTAWAGGLPSLNTNVVINGNYSTSVNGDFEACSCTVNTGAKLAINASGYVKVQNNISNQGTFVVESDGSLIQVNKNAINTGNITVEREANLKRLDYNYWGSPVSGQELKAFSPDTSTNRFYTYNETNDGFDVVAPVGNYFMAGKGYVVRAPNNFAEKMMVFKGVFKGLPNNGDITVPVTSTYNGFNLVGNPYPSNISFKDFYNANSNYINNIAYFWTNINPNPAMQYSNYVSGNAYNNYAIYNGSGGVPATGPAGSSVTPTEDLRIGQGFIIQAKNGGNVVFNNQMRNSKTTAKFFNRNSSASRVDVDRFWLQLTTPLEVASKILIAYKKEATNLFDVDYDAPHMVIGADSFYTLLDQEKLAIQGRAYPLQQEDVVSLGASFYAAGVYTISLEEKEGVFANGQAIYLKDKVTGKITNLQKESYSFSVDDKGEINNRFEITYAPNATLATQDITTQGVKIYKVTNGYRIIAYQDAILSLEVWDMAGQQIKSIKLNTSEYFLDTQNLQTGVYLIKVKGKKKEFQQKIIR